MDEEVPRPEGEPPSMLVVVNEEMRRQFAAIGEVVTFDLTFKMIKGESEAGGRWKLGCFLGTSPTKRMVPLALVVTLLDNTQVYVRFLRTFFLAMKGQPAVLITDEEKAIGAAVKMLQDDGTYRGRHLLDVFHILMNVRKKLNDK